MSDFEVTLPRGFFQPLTINVTEQEKDEICPLNLTAEETSLLEIYFQINNIFSEVTYLFSLDIPGVKTLQNKILDDFVVAKNSILREKGDKLKSDYLDEQTVSLILQNKKAGRTLENAAKYVLETQRDSLSPKDEAILSIFVNIENIFREASDLVTLNYGKYADLQDKLLDEGFDIAKKAVLRTENGYLASNYLTDPNLLSVLNLAMQDDSLEEAVAEVLGVKANAAICRPAPVENVPIITSITPKTLIANGEEQEIVIRGRYLEMVGSISIDPIVKLDLPREEGTNLTKRTVSVTVPKDADLTASYTIELRDLNGNLIEINPPLTINLTEQSLPTVKLADFRGDNSKAEVVVGYALETGNTPENLEAQGNGEISALQLHLNWSPEFSFRLSGDDLVLRVLPEGYLDYALFPNVSGGEDQGTHRLVAGGGLGLGTEPIENLWYLTPYVKASADYRKYSEQFDSLTRPYDAERILNLRSSIGFSPAGFEPLTISLLYGLQKGWFRYAKQVLSEGFYGEKVMHEYGLGVKLKLPKFLLDTEFTLAGGTQDEPDDLSKNGTWERDIGGHHLGVRLAFPNHKLIEDLLRFTLNHRESGLREMDHWLATISFNTEQAGKFSLAFGQTDGALMNPLDIITHHRWLLNSDYAFCHDGSKIPIFAYLPWEMPWVKGIVIAPFLIQNSPGGKEWGGFVGWDPLKTFMPPKPKEEK